MDHTRVVARLVGSHCFLLFQYKDAERGKPGIDFIGGCQSNDATTGYDDVEGSMGIGALLAHRFEKNQSLSLEINKTDVDLKRL